MSRLVLSAFVLLSVILLPGAAARAALVLGGFDASRAGSGRVFDGDYSTDVMTLLHTNFPDNVYETAPTLTPEFLAGIDILVLTPAKDPGVSITALSAGEQTAFFDFVKAGGRALVIGEGANPYWPAAQSFVAPFGMTISDDGAFGPLYCEATDMAHPVIDGPFGLAAAMLVYGSGKLSLGPYADGLAKIQANGGTMLAAIESNAIAPGSGRVVFIADTNPWLDADDGGFASLPEHQALFLNSINYLATPEPGTLALAAIGGVGLFGIVASQRSARRARSRHSR